MDAKTFLAKLQAQRFRKDDSQIASTIMHPGEAAQRAAEWLSSQVQTAANAPMTKNAPGFEKAASAGLNLAGLLQTGAMPFAPKGAGVLGTIRKPEDIVLSTPRISHYRLDPSNPAFEKFNKKYARTYGTDNDQLVKMADTGAPDVDAISKVVEMAGIIKPNNSRAGQALKHLSGGYIKDVKKDFGINLNTSKTLYDFIPSIAGDNPSKADLAYKDKVAKVVSELRASAGGHQSAKTDFGKFIEDVNDLHLAHSIAKPAKSRSGAYTDEELFYLAKNTPTQPDVNYYSRILDQQKKDLSDVFNSDYYKDNKPRIIVAPDLASTAEAVHMNDVLRITPGMTLEDAVRATLAHDRAAKIAAEKASKKGVLEQSGQHVSSIGVNGHSIRKLSTPEELEAEGTFQGHCVGNYCGKVKSGLSEIYSIRDADGAPTVTIEYDPKLKSIVQAKGRFNADPAGEHAQHVEKLKNITAAYRSSPQYFKDNGVNSFEDLLKAMDLED